MRELTPEECEFIAGGLSKMEKDKDGNFVAMSGPENEPPIVVVGSPPPPPVYPPPPPPVYPPYPPPPGTGGGGGATPSVPAATYTPDTPCADGTAAGAGAKIHDIVKSNPEGAQDVEYAALIARTAVGYGAYNDEIRTSNSPTYVQFNVGAIPSADLANMVGMVHNHPWNSSDYYQNFVQRYPSAADWTMLDKMAGAGANPNELSVYVVDGWGTVREYKYNDREALNGLDDNQRKNGVMLGSEAQPC
jgi:hypothetical protein